MKILLYLGLLPSISASCTSPVSLAKCGSIEVGTTTLADLAATCDASSHLAWAHCVAQKTLSSDAIDDYQSDLFEADLCVVQSSVCQCTKQQGPGITPRSTCDANGGGIGCFSDRATAQVEGRGTVGIY